VINNVAAVAIQVVIDHLELRLQLERGAQVPTVFLVV
jgi:hypothetical protein